MGREETHTQSKTSTNDSDGSTVGEEEYAVARERPLIHYVLLICIFSLCWNVVTVFTPEPVGLLKPSDEIPGGCADGLAHCVCLRSTVCATDMVSVICLFLARSGAYFTYPLYVLLFLSKCRNLLNWLETTALSAYIPFHDVHNLHTTAGKFAAFDVMHHSFWHLLRWGLNHDLDLLWETQTGRTGLVCLIMTPFLTWPMIFPKLKARISWEVRKYFFHNLAFVWGIGLALHAPARYIIYVIGIPVLLYIIDWFYGFFWNTHLVRSTEFRRLGLASSLSFENPPGFKIESASYVLIMLPWLDKKEWHAFTIFPHPTREGWSSICAAITGNESSWTRRLHTAITRPTCRPAWICGPYLSPYATAMHFDNIIAVASGIGITPALSLLSFYSDTRRINLIWMCRDSSLIEYYLDTVDFVDDAFVLVYYTGKTPLNVNVDDLPANVFIYKGRPNLEDSVTGIVYSIESGSSLPEKLMKTGRKIEQLTPLQKFFGKLFNRLSVYTDDEVFNAALEATTEMMPIGTSARNVNEFGEHIDMEPSSYAESRFNPARIAKQHSTYGHKFNIPTGRKTSIATDVGSKVSDDGNNSLTRMVNLRNKGSNPMVSLGRKHSVAGGNNMRRRAPRRGTGAHAKVEDNSTRNLCRMTNHVINISSEGLKRALMVILDDEASFAFGESVLDEIIEDVIDIDEGEDKLDRDEFKIFLDKLVLRMTKDDEMNLDRFHQKESHDKKSAVGSRATISPIAADELGRSGKRSTHNRFSAMNNMNTSDLAEIELGKEFCEMAGRDVISNWGMLYCGGAQPVVDSLTEIKEEYGFSLSVEKFDW